MPTEPTRREIAAPHVHETACLVLSERDPCSSTAAALKAANPMRTTAKGPIGRDIRPIAPKDLANIKAAKSWLLITLLCDGDDLAALIAWARLDPARAERVRFYHHQSVQPGPLLRPWATAGLPMPRIDAFNAQRDLSARFGQDLLQRIVDDFGPSQRRVPI